MLYAIIATDKPNSGARRTKTRSLHMAYIKPLMDAGHVILAGPHPAIDSPEPSPTGMTGSLIVAEFASLADAEAWASNDPYRTDGVFDEVVVKPFIRVFP